MTRTCRRCGTENQDRALFCAHCGQQLKTSLPSLQGMEKALEDAARVIDEWAQSPPVKDAVRAAGQAWQQINVELNRASQRGQPPEPDQPGADSPSEESLATADALIVSTARTEPLLAKRQALSGQKPCLRCGAANRLEGKFCSTCGSAFAVPEQPLHYVTACHSNMGRSRPNNEDTVRVWDLQSEGIGAWMLLVADGMGGEAAGEIASQQVAQVVDQEIAQRFTRGPQRPKSAEIERWLALILRQANASIFQQAQTHPTWHGMGTTATLLWLEQSLAVIGHVGDSRAYLIPPEGPWWQITEDHTLLALLVGVGEQSPEEAAADPEAHLLYRAVGHAVQLQVDTYVRRVEPGDRLLLCSDGLTRHVTDPEIVAVVRRQTQPTPACQSLINLANHRGGEDNISLALAVAGLPPAQINMAVGRKDP